MITGATSGIGKASAKKFAKKGFNLILTGRRKEKLEAISKKLTVYSNEFINQYPHFFDSRKNIIERHNQLGKRKNKHYNTKYK